MRVLYQDNHLLVVEKPPGVLSQSDRPDGDDDLLNTAKAYIKREFNKPGAVWLGLVHRLDRDVGGVMILARTSKAAARLSEEIRSGRTRKVYRAWLESQPRLRDGDESPASGDQQTWIRLHDSIAKDSKRRMAVPGVPAGTRSKGGAATEPPRSASLRYRILNASPKSGPMQVEIELETGRFHQIRYQFASRGAPLLGDRKYGSQRALPGVKLALYCVEMSVRHPVRDEVMSFTCKPPAAWTQSPA